MFSGAIKFGDKLTLEQCTNLVKLLKQTKFPNRCAHGRPTIIPVMEYSELGRRNARVLEVCIIVVSFTILLLFIITIYYYLLVIIY